MTKTLLRVFPASWGGGDNLCTKPISLLMQNREYVNSNMALSLVCTNASKSSQTFSNFTVTKSHRSAGHTVQVLQNSNDLG